MKRRNGILSVCLLAVLFCGCSRVDPVASYNEGRLYYLDGELTKAVSSYIQCVSYSPLSGSEQAAYAYRDLATICHLEGNNRMAYEINEKSVSRFEHAGASVEHSYALCRSAVYLACRGNREEAATQLRHVCALCSDSVIQNTAAGYSQIIQSGQLPVLNDDQIQADASELYNAVRLIRDELYRKPSFYKVLIIILLFLFCFLCVYVTHSGMLKHLHDLRKEKKDNRQMHEEDIQKLCSFLKEHPEELKKELHWSDYAKMCPIVNLRFGGLIEKLQKWAALNETETRLCVLVLIDLPRNRIAEILPYASNSVGKLKNTVAKKLQTDGKNLHNLLVETVITSDKFP